MKETKICWWVIFSKSAIKKCSEKQQILLKDARPREQQETRKISTTLLLKKTNPKLSKKPRIQNLGFIFTQEGSQLYEKFGGLFRLKKLVKENLVGEKSFLCHKIKF